MKDYTVQKTKLGDLALLILRPVKAARPREKTPGILWIHGGGYAVGMAGIVYMSRALALVRKYGAVVVTPEYRLAGKAPYPAALEDCYAALLYLKEHAASLGCNEDQLMVGGESAGGGLTAALCMYARDRGEVNIAFQMPLYPMLDDRDTESSRDNHGLFWNTKRNHAAWKLYLSGLRGEIPPYAAPARQTDYSRLPPAYTFVGDREAFYCETVCYIENLKKAGIPAHADIYPTGLHAFDMLLPLRKISKQAIAAFEKQYLYAQSHYFAKQSHKLAVTVRKYRSEDLAELAQLFYETVHTVNAKDYTREQLNAWATGQVDMTQWDTSFQAHYAVVAELDGRIVGFGDMDDTGYLDRLYVRKDLQRRGIATAICDALEENCPADAFTTHASVTARPFFENRGYTVLQEQQVERRGARLINFLMKKTR